MVANSKLLGSSNKCYKGDHSKQKEIDDLDYYCLKIMQQEHRYQPQNFEGAADARPGPAATA